MNTCCVDGGLLLFSATMPAMAQDRLPPIPAEKQTPEQRKAAEAFRPTANRMSSGRSCRCIAAPR